ncbi:MAG: hypothetical protein A2001_12505 [Treponema sp. GWC1_61_84]|nr:MAG: hypothetical protein A2001_12505 [Treponema sp. GWC1_61_84]
MPNKRRVLRLAASAFAGILVAASASFIETERPLGTLYDWLLGKRPSPSFPRELLLIESSPTSDSMAGDASTGLVGALLAMTEMEASRALILMPIGLSIRNDDGSDAAQMELERRFDEEFEKIERNISTLFDAIKLGSIRSRDSSNYVARLISLVGEGKSRLIEAAESSNLDGIARFERAASAFGQVWLASDVPGSKPAASSVAGSGYSRLPRDGDGALRRIVPVDPESGQAHVAFAALLDKLGTEGLELPLDRTGAFLADAPRGTDAGIRRLPLDAFTRYSERGRKLYLELKEMERAGYFDSIDPSSYPTAIWEFSESAKEEMLKAGNAETRRDWRESRVRYLASVEALFTGKAETTLLGGYDALLDSPTLSEEGKDSVRALRDAVRNSFSRSREAYAEFSGLRKELDEALNASFCIVGSASADTEAAAVLITDIMADRFFRRADYRTAFIAVSLSALALALLILPLDGFLALGIGLFASIAAALGFSAFFVYGDLWISPAVAALSCVAATVASVGSRAIADARAQGSLRRSFRRRLSDDALSGLMENPQISLLHGRAARSAILAVRANGISLFSDGDDPAVIIEALRAYAKETARIVAEMGGTTLGADGDLVFAAFGSPVDEAAGGGAVPAGEAVARAARAALALRDAKGGPVLRVGLDIGECAFGDGFLGDGSSYAAFGSPAVRARLLSSIASRYEGRILITEAFKRELGDDFELRTLDLLVEQGKGTELAFHELIGRKS